MLCKYLLKMRKSGSMAEGLVWPWDVKPRAYVLEGTLQTLSSKLLLSQLLARIAVDFPSQARQPLPTLSLRAWLEPAHGGFCLDLHKEKCGTSPI